MKTHFLDLQTMKQEKASRKEAESRLYKEIDKLSETVTNQGQEHDAEKTSLETKLANQALLLQDLDRQLSSQRGETSSTAEALTCKHRELQQHKESVTGLKQVSKHCRA